MLEQISEGIREAIHGRISEEMIPGKLMTEPLEVFALEIQNLEETLEKKVWFLESKKRFLTEFLEDLKKSEEETQRKSMEGFP